MDGKTILIIDDDPDIHAMLKKRLERVGFECFSAYTVEVALTCLKRIDPDLVILDLGFPDGDGFDFLRSAKGFMLPGKAVPPIIVLSSIDDDPFVRAAIRLGAVGYVTKPYDHEALLDMVEDSISGNSSDEEADGESRHP